MQALHSRTEITPEQRCYLCFALAKAAEDMEDFAASFAYLKEGNELRKNVLGYSIARDIQLFSEVRTAAVCIAQQQRQAWRNPAAPVPVFILGMPRSGTTLVEQIASSHSEMTGAGELIFAEQFGASIARGASSATPEALAAFRTQYLSALRGRSDGKRMVTDKMPHNFRFIGLICAALPEAKIIHVQRDAAATCWSNYKHHFSTEDLGYAYDLKDLAQYYRLYLDLMQYWSNEHADRIYHLDYERLTLHPEAETRRFIKHLGLSWEDACLAPQDNTRFVQTSSSHQIREKIYQGSSQQWRPFIPWLKGAFDEL